MKRRLFLQTVPLLTAVVPTVIACSKEDMPALPESYDPAVEQPQSMVAAAKTGTVLIIGAGAAGLYAAWLLKQKGLTVSVLEAAPTHGGRLKALTTLADFPIELGAEEIHGSRSEWYKIVQASGARFTTNATTDYYLLDGLLKTENQIANDADVKKANTFISAARTYASTTDKTVAEHAMTQAVPTRTAHYVNAQIGNEYGTSNTRLSIKGIAEEDNLWTAGENNFGVANKSLLACLESKVSDVLPLITYNVQVQKVDYSGISIVITDQTGKTYTAAKVIITVPLSILKQNGLQFTPALPTSKTDSFQKIGMGAGMKIILKFSTRFWAADLGSLFGDGNVPEYWFTSNGRGTTPILTAFVMGDKAQTLTALTPDDAVSSVVAELDRFYGNTLASRALIGSHVEDWGKNPFIKGAYSFPIVGGGITQRSNLQKSVNNKLFWAGEAAHNKGHSGTVHGAIETGIWAANALYNGL
jgi:monoamine oxidase